MSLISSSSNISTKCFSTQRWFQAMCYSGTWCPHEAFTGFIPWHSYLLGWYYTTQWSVSRLYLYRGLDSRSFLTPMILSFWYRFNSLHLALTQSFLKVFASNANNAMWGKSTRFNFNIKIQKQTTTLEIMCTIPHSPPPFLSIFKQQKMYKGKNPTNC